MFTILEAKFNHCQHPDLAAKLSATKDATLVEHTRDAFWGDGIDGSGENKLGQLLMRVRDSLV